MSASLVRTDGPWRPAAGQPTGLSGAPVGAGAVALRPASGRPNFVARRRTWPEPRLPKFALARDRGCSFDVSVAQVGGELPARHWLTPPRERPTLARPVPAAARRSWVHRRRSRASFGCRLLGVFAHDRRMRPDRARYERLGNDASPAKLRMGTSSSPSAPGDLGKRDAAGRCACSSLPGSLRQIKVGVRQAERVRP